MTVFATIELVLAANGPYDVVCVWNIRWYSVSASSRTNDCISTYTDSRLEVNPLSSFKLKLHMH